MLKKILLVVANLILVLAPTFPITENFFAKVDQANLVSYFVVCGIISLLLWLTALFVSDRNNNAGYNNRIKIGSWLLFVLGILVMVPLHMGAPVLDETLIKAATEERWRYVLLIVATILFAVAIIVLISAVWKTLNSFDKLIVVPLLIAVAIGLWDYYDSFTFSNQLWEWTNLGKKASDFFPNFDFHHNLRAVGRILPYIIVLWLGIILFKKALIKKWIAIVLGLFCCLGVGFCLACVFKGFEFYFPFMVPAIVLSPAYWLGLALLNNKNIKTIE